MTAFITIVSVAVTVAASLVVAHFDDRRRHDRTVDDILARRYTQPRRIGAVWSDDMKSAPRSGRNYGLTTPASVRTPFAGSRTHRVSADDSTPAAFVQLAAASVAGVQERDDRPGSSPAGVNNSAI